MNKQAYTSSQIPKGDPQWDTNDDWEFQAHQHYQETFYGSMKEGRRKVMNMSKISDVLQGLEEDPSQFYQKLREAFCLYTPFNSEEAKNQ